MRPFCAPQSLEECREAREGMQQSVRKFRRRAKREQRELTDLERLAVSALQDEIGRLKAEESATGDARPDTMQGAH